MKNINAICTLARNKDFFLSIERYVEFGKIYSDFISDDKNYEARITSQNEHNYKF